MAIHYNSQLRSIEKSGDKLRVNVVDSKGQEESLVADGVLMATGRVPSIPEGVKELGIEYDRKGIKVNAGMQTNIKNIYATGDVNGIAPLFHAARRQSIVAANNIMSHDKLTDYFNPVAVPFTLFSMPQLAYVGILPSMAEKMGIKFRRATYEMERDTLAEIFNEMSGEIDLFFEEETMRIIGGYVIGNDAGNIINEIALGVEKGLTARDFAELSHQHPMTFEGLDTAARKFY